MKKNKRGLWLIIGALILIFVIPYARVEILSIDAPRKLASFDLSWFDNVYCEGTPEVYDCKIYAYSQERYAKVLYVLGDCEFGVMVELEWNHSDGCWEFVNGRDVWTIYGGSAQEFYWPLYYGGKLYPVGK